MPSAACKNSPDVEPLMPSLTMNTPSVTIWHTHWQQINFSGESHYTSVVEVARSVEYNDGRVLVSLYRNERLLPGCLI